MAARRTNQPVARAAIAHAAFFRSCGSFYAAMQPASWKRPFKAPISAAFRPTFRRVTFELTHRGQTGLVLVQPMQVLKTFACAAAAVRQLSKPPRPVLRSHRNPQNSNRPFTAVGFNNRYADAATVHRLYVNGWFRRLRRNDTPCLDHLKLVSSNSAR